MRGIRARQLRKIAISDGYLTKDRTDLDRHIDSAGRWRIHRIENRLENYHRLLKRQYSRGI